MAKAKLKTTDTLGKMDAKQLAEMLRRMGRGRDTVLAHITPREARKLKEMGGSGTINPETGLPEFFEDFGGYDASTQAFADYGDFSSPQFQEVLDTYSGDYGASPEAYDMSGYYFEPTFQQPTTAQASGYYEPTFGGGYEGTSMPAPTEMGYGGYAYTPSYEQPILPADLASGRGREVEGTLGRGILPPIVGTPANVPLPPPRPAEFGGVPGQYEEYVKAEEERAAEEGRPSAARAEGKGYLEQLFGKLDLATLAKLGLAGGAAMMGRRQQGQAVQQAQRAADQMKAAYTQAGQELRQLAQPTLGPAITGLAQAQQGALDPARLRQLEIERARLAQAAAKTGGVGAIQSAEAMNRARQDALTAQQSAALQLLGPSNTLLAQAIQANLSGTTQGLGLNLQLQQQANQAAANLYGQLGRFSGMA